MPKFNPGLIAGLFNEESQAVTKTDAQEPDKANSQDSQIKLINIYDIVPNEYNKNISMEGIEDLKVNIGLVGLQQNLVVTPPKDGKYTLIAGHRRLAALKMLVENDGREEFREVEAKITNPDDFEYELSPTLKNAFYWVASNVDSRQPTRQDLLTFVGTLNTVYKELKKNNPELKLPMKKDFIANQLQISKSQVYILNTINAHLIDEALNAFLDNKLPLVVARDLAKLSAAHQKEFLSNFEDFSTITAHDLENFIDKKREESKQPTFTINHYTQKNFESVSTSINTVLHQLEEKELVGDKANKAQNITNALISNLQKLTKLLEK